MKDQVWPSRDFLDKLGIRIMKLIEIFTDGSSLGNPGPGGFAAIIRTSKKEIIVKGHEANTTNNRMEMTALIEALNKLPSSINAKIEVFSDSRLLISTMQKGWKKKENIDLWKQLEKLCGNKNISWHWVKGHASHKENIKVDKLAQSEASKIAKTNKPLNASKTAFFCNRCNKAVKGKLSTLPQNGLIRADCELCGKFIKFAKHTKEILKRAEIKQQLLF